MLHKQSKGVSPIVGVILMIFLTIILAGIISQFGLELSNLLEQPTNAGLNIQESYNVQEDTYDVRVLWSNQGNVESMYINTEDGSRSPTLSEVGDSIRMTDLEEDTVLTIIGQRSDGSTGVVREYTVG